MSTTVLSLADLEGAAALVHSVMPPTAQICWPLLSARCGCEVWVKHENHTAIGSFKLRGAMVYVEHLLRCTPLPRGVVACTKGNFGQGVAYAARRFGFSVWIVVPRNNSPDKNASIRALGATLVEHGSDFEEAYEHAEHIAETHGLTMIPSYHPLLTLGVASYSLELLRAVPRLSTLYVPIGQGSGISGAVAARDCLGSKATIVGVVSERLPAYALSFKAGRPVTTPPATSIADGMSVRVPVTESLDVIRCGVDRVLTVSEEQISTAMRHLFTDAHNVAEGAGAVALAGLLSERELVAGECVGVVLTGGNVDRAVFANVLAAG